ncbi:sirohydrochlorin chelatase [Agromyces larvae]|uniref:Cobalamin biosynthesis protein CbiX n=1 Tax=Agromyces larvae TaxID=2929802 RepID=A0ABY4BVP0_9MICO|nr:CbiX/SirB N-terminal domain-containing protein [Agromyces larvae]UOE43267.1 cobalamin biosynthesis protein CbiX [Agromyces larvae]
MTTPALLGISHGTASPDGQRAVRALVDAVAAELPEVTVRLGHVDVQQPDVDASIATIPPGESIVLVPLLLSAGYHVHVDIREATAAHPHVQIAGALGPDGRLVEVLVRRLAQAGLSDAGLADPDAGPDALVLAVAGSSDRRAVDDCLRMGELLATRLGRPVTVGFLSAAEPRLDAAVAAARADAPGRRVVVSSYLLAPGYFQDLAAAAGADVLTEPLLAGDAPAPELVEVVIDRYRDCLDAPVASSL